MGNYYHDEQNPVVIRKKKPRYFLWFRSIAFFVFSIIVILLIIGINYHVDKVIISPGTAENVSNAISIVGTKQYKPDGKIRFLTVFVSASQPSFVKYLKARYVDKDSEILSWKEVNGDQSAQQSNALSEALMKQSQNASRVVALEQLGCTIGEEGSGAIVSEVQKGSPAYEKIKPGDVITQVDSSPINLSSDLSKVIQKHSPGDTVKISILEESTQRHKNVQIELGSRKDDESKGFLGVAFFTYKQVLNFPVDIKINPGEVSGPSAGLAFSLSIIDQLTSGNLTGGKDIAVTGEIEFDGTVAPVGGVAQKAIAARNSGATIMIVPRGEGKQARRQSGKMKVYEVTSIDDALKVLEENGGDPLPHMRTCPS